MGLEENRGDRKETAVLSTTSIRGSAYHRLISPHSDHLTPDTTQLSGYPQTTTESGKIPSLEIAEHRSMFGSGGAFE